MQTSFPSQPAPSQPDPAEPAEFHLTSDQIKFLDYLHDMTQQLYTLAEMGRFEDVKMSLNETLTCINALR